MARPIRASFIAPRALALALAIAGGACAAAPPARIEGGNAAGNAVVAEIIDGDTVVLDLANGRRERVRLLGIDTPETSHPTRPVECFGAEATAHLAALAPPGTQLRIERDIEGRDHFGRLLLYLFRADDELFLNLEMVATGHATTLHVDPNGAYRHTLAAAESEARASALGLWAACGGPGVPLDPLSPEPGSFAGISP
jgi:micrococcal nuclease